jgi:membrane-associated protease RseP (regulator of RpoE activity)
VELKFTLPVINIRLRFSFWFFAVSAFFLLLDHRVLFWYMALPVFIHEAGHLFAMSVCKVKVKEIFFTPVSIRMERAGGETSYLCDIIIAAGGAFCNLTAALIIHIFAFASMRNMLLVASNIAVAMISLLPIGSLDGGQIVRAAVTRRKGPGHARRISLAVSFLALVPLTAAAGYLALRGAVNFTPALLCVYLIVTVIARD